MEKVENRVAGSGLVNIEWEKLYPQGERAAVDMKDFLEGELILREKRFRTAVKGADWSRYRGKFVAVHCSVDAILPAWAYMLVAVHLQPFAAKTYTATPEAMEEFLFREAIGKMDIERYRGKKVLVNGCSGNLRVPASAFADLAARLLPVAASIMYGEACSSVPIYKRSAFGGVAL